MKPLSPAPITTARQSLGIEVARLRVLLRKKKTRASKRRDRMAKSLNEGAASPRVARGEDRKLPGEGGTKT